MLFTYLQKSICIHGMFISAEVNCIFRDAKWMLGGGGGGYVNAQME